MFTLYMPELVLALGALGSTVLSFHQKERIGLRISIVIALFSIAIAALILLTSPPIWQELDSFGLLMKVFLLGGAGFVLLLTERKPGIDGLVLLGTLGAFIVATANDLITLFVGTQLLSITIYLFINIKSKTSAWRVFLYGIVSSAFFLNGISFLYGLTGSVQYSSIRGYLPNLMESGQGILVYIAFALLVVGIGWLMVLAPFHRWFVQSHETMTSSVNIFFSIMVRATAMLTLFRLLFTVVDVMFQDLFWNQTVMYILLIISLLSFVIGYIGAWRQKKLSRLIAYSGVLHGGILLIAWLGMHGYPVFYYYLVTSLLMHGGAYVVADRLQREKIDSVQGLYQRSPILAIGLSLFLLSMAGVPLTAGFFGKFYLFLSVFGGLQYVVMLVVVALFAFLYPLYFRWIRAIFEISSVEVKPITNPFPTLLLLFICGVGTLLLGMFPHLFLETVTAVIGY